MDGDEIRHQVMAVFETLRQAMLNQDAETISACVAEDYQGSDAGGVPHDRSAMLQAYGPGGVTLHTFDVSDVTVRSWPGTALVAGTTCLQGTYGSHVFEHDARFLDVYAKRGGRWQLVASHVTDRKASVSAGPDG